MTLFRWFVPLFALAPVIAGAQTWPDKPIRLVVPFSAGGPTDVAARLIEPKLRELLKQPVIIDNRVGATGAIGSELVAKAAPDGYTLLLGTSSTMAASPNLNPKLSYDPLHDFAPVSIIAHIENVLVVNPSVPVKSVAELIAYAKANPGKLSYATSGIGSTYHLATELFKSQTGIDLLHVPYKGAAPAAADVLGGQVSLMFDALSAALANIKAGKIRALGIASAKRNPELPEVPTITEAGVPGYVTTIWLALYLPAKTPQAIVAKLNEAVVKAMGEPEVKRRLAQAGMLATSSTPQELLEHNRAEIARWGKVVRDANIHLE
jgi:tripartite-type tricarboxylate transporter receptor subunit TctC